MGGGGRNYYLEPEIKMYLYMSLLERTSKPNMGTQPSDISAVGIYQSILADGS